MYIFLNIDFTQLRIKRFKEGFGTCMFLDPPNDFFKRELIVLIEVTGEEYDFAIFVNEVKRRRELLGDLTEGSYDTHGDGCEFFKG